MPEFPRHQSQAQPTTQQPSIQAPTDNTGEVVAKVGENIGSAIQTNTLKWSNAVDTIQKTASQANFKSGMLDIQQRAANDPNYNNSDQYFKEIEKLKSESLKGFSSKTAETEMAIDLDYESKVGQIAIGGLYKKKMIDVGQTAILKNLDLMSRDSGDIDNRIEKFLAPQIRNGIIGREEAYKLQKEYGKKARYNSFLTDLNNDSSLAEKNLSENTYGFEMKDLESAKNMLKKGKDDSEKNLAIQQNQGEEAVASLIVSDASMIEAIDTFENLYKRGEISEENYRVAKKSFETKNAGKSKSEDWIGLMMDYSKIAQSEDPVKAVRAFRNEVMIKKSKLSEKHYKEMLSLSGAEQLKIMEPKLKGLEKLLDSWSGGSKKNKEKLELTKNFIEVTQKYITDQYKPGQEISKGGYKFKVVTKDDGSIGFEVMK